jgi:hypothetical protein
MTNRRILAAIGCLLTATTAQAAEWVARTDAEGGGASAYGQVTESGYTAGPAGQEIFSEQVSQGSVRTFLVGNAEASLENRSLKLASSQAGRQSASISDTLSDLQNQTNAVTLYYMAQWIPFAGFDLTQPGNAGTISLDIEIFYPTLGQETMAGWTIDLKDTPCPYVNQDCRTSDLLLLKEIPDKVTYTFAMTSYSGALVEEFQNYDANLKIGFGEILPCPPGSPFFGVGRCVVPVSHQGGPGVGGPNGFWPPIAQVPEPTSWSMMLAGFGAAGLALRRRRRTGLSFPERSI